MAPKGLTNAGKGRPKGAKNRVPKDLRALAQTYGEEALYELVKLARGQPRVMGTDKQGKPIVGDPVPYQTQAFACSLILDRGYGKAPQAVTGEGGSGRVTVNITEELYPVEYR
jgi:hypothetical protein